MKWMKVYDAKNLGKKADLLFSEQKKLKRLDGWFLIKEIQAKYEKKFSMLPRAIKAARILDKVVEELPISISKNAVFAGTQNDAFAKSYALINPNFKVETFSGYCEPAAVFNDITPNKEFTKNRIGKMKKYVSDSEFAFDLQNAYREVGGETKEAVFFIEQVTGHTIADFRPVINGGIRSLLEKIDEKIKTADKKRRENYHAMAISLYCGVKLSLRYAEMAEKQAKKASAHRKKELLLMAETLRKVPFRGATNLFEALQSFIILWQVMAIEQAPNPFAFSAGNVDRFFEPYRRSDNAKRKITAALLRHFLVFFNVGDRSWAISQNILVGGRSSAGKDLSNETSFALMDAFYESNFPQPILSVKLHEKTSAKFYEELGRFFFSPGVLTPSLFNDDSIFKVLKRSGVDAHDLEDYAVAGCQEPLIMGKENGNTTNSWLNLAKILELTLNNGHSAITGKKIGLSYRELGLDPTDPKDILRNVRTAFYSHLEYSIKRMVKAANGCSEAISLLTVPFLSSFMGGIGTGIDMRDTKKQGTEYNASGCLIHGLSVMADSFIAIDQLLKDRPEDSGRLIRSLKNNFKNNEDLRQYLISCQKYGNNFDSVDKEAKMIAEKVSKMVSAQKNYLGNPFKPDWSSPSTHLLYGYWVGATPDGRKAREMLNYGLDPLYGEACSGLGFRILSIQKMPFEKMCGGYASHFGIDPKYFPERSFGSKGVAFRDRVIRPLFFSKKTKDANPFYLYVNVNTPEMLKKVLKDPKKYAPNGVYIVRIHGTFVNFLDLSPAIQKDIMLRLDPGSTKI